MVRNIQQVFAAVWQDDEGATLVEYILLAVLIGVAAIAGMTFLGQTSNNRMNNLGSTVASA